MKSITIETSKILKDKNKPVHYKEISNIVLKNRKLITNTPIESIRSILSLSKKFDSYGHGLYGLREWGFKWYKKYYNKGLYFSLEDICYVFIKKSGIISSEELLNKIDKKYPSRYKNLKQIVHGRLKDDIRLLKENESFKIRKLRDDFFGFNDMMEVSKVLINILHYNNRPTYYKELLKEVKIKKANKLSPKDLLLVWLATNNKFAKLGPKGYFGLKEWVK